MNILNTFLSQFGEYTHYGNEHERQPALFAGLYVTDKLYLLIQQMSEKIPFFAKEIVEEMVAIN